MNYLQYNQHTLLPPQIDHVTKRILHAVLQQEIQICEIQVM